MVNVVSTGISARPAGWISAARLRLALFLAIAGVMIAGPTIEQIFGARTVFWRSWKMFSAIGIGVIDASFAIRQPDGTFVPLDRFALLGERHDGKLKRIENVDELAFIVDRLCAAAGTGAYIRVTARQATRNGWHTLRSDPQNVCPD